MMSKDGLGRGPPPRAQSPEGIAIPFTANISFFRAVVTCQPHHLFHCVVRREHFTFLDSMADHAVQRLDGIRCVDHLTDVCRVNEERRQVSPVCLPAPTYLR